MHFPSVHYNYHAEDYTYWNYALCTQLMGARDISLSCMWSSLISLLAIF